MLKNIYKISPQKKPLIILYGKPRANSNALKFSFPPSKILMANGLELSWKKLQPSQVTTKKYSNLHPER